MKTYCVYANDRSYLLYKGPNKEDAINCILETAGKVSNIQITVSEFDRSKGWFETQPADVSVLHD